MQLNVGDVVISALDEFQFHNVLLVADDFNALIQPGIIVQKQVLVMLCFGKRTIVIFLVRLAVLADKSDYP